MIAESRPEDMPESMPVGFGRVYCKMNAERDAPSETAAADTGDASSDGLAFYAAEFTGHG